MPKEKSLNDPLSGAEIKMIAVQKFAEALDRDCTLTDDITYPGFKITFNASLIFTRSAMPGTMLWGDQTVGDKPEGDLDVKTANFEYQTNEPNRAREENDLPIPVMIQTPAGPRREKVKFDKGAYGRKK